MFTVRGLAVEFPEVPKCLRSKSLIELNGIYSYTTRWGVSCTQLFHRQSLWKSGSKSLNLKQCTPVTLPSTRNLLPEDRLPASICQGEQIGSNGLAWEMAALRTSFVVPETHFWEKERHVMNWKRVCFRNSVRKWVLATYGLIFLGWVMMLKAGNGFLCKYVKVRGEKTIRVAPAKLWNRRTCLRVSRMQEDWYFS